MAYFSIDREAVHGARMILAEDPSLLHALAGEVSAAGAAARACLGPEWAGLAEAIDRFRVVHGHAIDAVAEAAAALGGDLDLVIAGSAETELAVSSALGSVTGRLGLSDAIGAA